MLETPEGKVTQETVERFFGLLGAGDLDGLADAFADTVDWYVPGSAEVPWTGPRSRRAQVIEYFTLMGPAFVPSKAEMSIEKTLIDGSDAVVLAQLGQTVAASSRDFRMRVAFHFTVMDGLIVRMHMYEDTYLVAQALGVID
ncbi:nuclear transport factor 2 family protein [Streptomyces sp. enrichment culture]|uniref:nuclear transport factor 2 family protein n=1 Tax=Streptomyces sp. enrichment culture TaxID=1795815 RepID=UPI003F548A16